MPKKLFVGNLSYEVTEQDLEGLFAPYGGTSSVTLVKDRFSGTSKGFGFVELASDDEATRAKQELNGTDWKGRALRVDDAKELSPRTERTGFGGRGRSPGASRGGGFRSGRSGGGSRFR